MTRPYRKTPGRRHGRPAWTWTPEALDWVRASFAAGVIYREIRKGLVIVDADVRAEKPRPGPAVRPGLTAVREKAVELCGSDPGRDERPSVGQTDVDAQRPT